MAFDHRNAARRLISHFWKSTQLVAADAVLLVTCRSPGEGSERAMQRLLGDWLFTDVPGRLTDTIGRVHVGDFNPEELGEAARALGVEYWRRLSPALERDRHSNSVRAVLGDDAFPSAGDRPVHPVIAASLLQPAMWGALVELPPNLRHSVLDGEPSALSELAERFLDRFCRKSTRRRPTLLADRILKALRAICAAIEGGPSELTRERHWIEPARGPMMDEEAAYLFNEAISYGLISEDARGRWAWRHSFICGHLKGR